VDEDGSGDAETPMHSTITHTYEQTWAVEQPLVLDIEAGLEADKRRSAQMWNNFRVGLRVEGITPTLIHEETSITT
jgi:hypothetical protein